MKNKILTYRNHTHHLTGFSLLEFLIASALSMIVLMAVSSGYFTARKLNSTATSRLSVQQDLRNAATLIVRDARMAGTFGCFSMSGQAAATVKKDNGGLGRTLLTPNKTPLFAVNEVPAADLGLPSGFTANAIVFQYGSDSKTFNNQTVVVSSCNNISKPGTTIKNTDDARTALGISGNTQNGSIAIMQHTVNAYTVGTSDGISGLFRIQLKADGEWSNPQLLVRGVQSMDVNYLYVTPSTCPSDAVATETFDEQSKLLDNINNIPASIRITLNNGNAIEAGDDKDNKVLTYNINATVRGGNTCANRSL